MLRRSPLIVVLALFAVACDSDTATAPEADDLATGPQLISDAANPVVHRVSAGGGDTCLADGDPRGCDANYSLVARQKADGSVKGQWQDTFKQGFDGAVPVHVTIDCLYVSGNQAWVSGMITGGPFAGFPVITRVADNGTSANDAPDQIGWTLLDTFGGCMEAPDLPLYDADGGQVKVW